LSKKGKMKGGNNDAVSVQVDEKVAWFYELPAVTALLWKPALAITICGYTFLLVKVSWKCTHLITV